MAKHIVEVVESFEVRTQLGALTVTNMTSGDKTVIDKPRELVCNYTEGQRLEFRTKKDAEAFAKHHGAKVRYVGKG